jgi:hypothetical protein
MIKWDGSITKMPIVVKGILRPDDAELAVQHGVAAIAVSNHGGRQLDGVPATVIHPFRLDLPNYLKIIIPFQRSMRFLLLLNK